ncbi:MAG: Ig-like domain-containing protein, partial [Balneolales bacterium]|nr:Ig-like domain-containing protein [Balneolales bacterium]
MKSFLKRLSFAGLLMVMFSTSSAFAQTESPAVTGLSEWSIFIDPGHSMTENMGLYNYSEAEKVLRVGLYLRDMLLEQTDIGAVHMARTNDGQSVGLTQRTVMANETGADFYYSIHSDAGAPHVNSTLMLWGANGMGVEKTPTGGKKMGDIMDVDLTASMRIARRGSRADSPFYGAPTSRTSPWLAVNRLTNMASVLSEAGFHTNPTQQMRNLNQKWKKLEAQSAFWSILEYHGLERPPVGIVTGYITNQENGELINGATITIGDQSYTTDTFESLFNKYTSDPDLLANGFYYLEGFDPGSSQTVTVEAEGYYPQTVNTQLRSNFFTFVDVSLVSNVPPTVTETHPIAGATHYDQLEPIQIELSRRVVASSLDGQISISPEVDFTHQLINNGRTLRISAPEMDFLTEYTITLGSEIEDLSGHKFDGNGDGSEGGVFTLTFTTRDIDVDPPVVVSVSPAAGSESADRKSIISFTLDELVNPASINDESIELVPVAGGSPVSVIVKHYSVGDRSVIQAFPQDEMASFTEYVATLNAGIEDLSGNATTAPTELTFITNNLEYEYNVIDSFNSGITSWWVPQQSGSTTGIVTEGTSRDEETVIVNPITGSTGSMALNYSWDESAATHLIRNYIAPGAAQNNTRVNANQMLEVFVFGDGTSNRIRFMLRDGDNQLEGSPWYTVDWIGWKLVRWD